MPKLLKPGQTYRNRSPKIVVMTITLDRHTRALLRELEPNQKSTSSTLAALVIAEHARREERKRLQEKGV